MRPGAGIPAQLLDHIRGATHFQPVDNPRLRDGCVNLLTPVATRHLVVKTAPPFGLECGVPW